MKTEEELIWEAYNNRLINEKLNFDEVFFGDESEDIESDLEYWFDREDGIMRRNYGITMSEYKEILKSQGDGCAICGRKSDVADRRLAVDHCHESGDVRGVLCSLCNQALGLFLDKPELLRAAADYLESKPFKTALAR